MIPASIDEAGMGEGFVGGGEEDRLEEFCGEGHFSRFIPGVIRVDCRGL